MKANTHSLRNAGETNRAAANTQRNVSMRMPLSESSRKAGFCMQLRTTLWRVLILRRRGWCASICEFVTPLMFLLGIVGLWLLIGSEKGIKEDLLDPNSLQTGQMLYNTLFSGLCITENGPTGVDISKCPKGREGNSVYCAPTDSSTTVPDGVCVTAKAVGAYADLFENYTGNATTYVPSLGELLARSWVDELLISAFPDLKKIPNIPKGISGRLFFAPRSPHVEALEAAIRADPSLPITKFFNSTIFDTVEEAISATKQRKSNEPLVWALIEIKEWSDSGYNVAIHMNASALPSTRSAFNTFYYGGVNKTGGSSYVFSGFLTFQNAIAAHFFDKTNRPQPASQVKIVQPMPVAAYDVHVALTATGVFIPLLIVWGFAYPVVQLTRRIVLEKALRVREAMLIMGLSQTVMYTSWFVIQFVQYLIISIIFAVVMKVSFLEKSDFGFIFLLMFVFTMTLISISILISTFFDNVRLSALITPLLYFILSVPPGLIQMPSANVQIGLSVMPPSAMVFAMQRLMDHEAKGGFRRKEVTDYLDDPNFLVLILMLIAEFFVYGLLALYLDAVLPKKYGVRRSPVFFLNPLLRLCSRRRRKEVRIGGIDGRVADGVFEKVPSSDTVAVEFCGLRKEFSSCRHSFLAVDNFYWQLQKNKISVLLGHNGAGKSTLINLITGMTQPSAGDCFIYGKSVRHELSSIRHGIGYCPQHNILWPELTVKEHLEYFGAIKGLHGSVLKAEVNEVLRTVGLEEKTTQRSKRLSGGQKRKLSVAIALIGGSSLVILDEPTAGMDAGSRRSTWEALKETSKRRTILMTTHFMDEADLLGHTIAIMNKGRLECAGNSAFLKSKLGAGYVLTMSVELHCPRRPVEAMIMRYVKGAVPQVTGAGEMAYRLPVGSTAVFPQLLSALDNEGTALGVKSYSLSATTMEDVFLRVTANKDGEEDEAEAILKEPAELTKLGEGLWNVQKVSSGCQQTMMQFKAMFQKHFWNALRDRRTQFFQFLTPFVCVLLTLLLLDVNPPTDEPLILTPKIYKTTVDIFTAGCDGKLNLTAPFASNAKTQVIPSGKDLASMVSYLQSTYATHKNERLGALVCDYAFLNLNSPAVLYNFSTPHEIAVSTSNYHNGLLALETGNAQALETVTTPLPLTTYEAAKVSQAFRARLGAIILIPFTFIPSTFVAYVVKERHSGARHLQGVSGLRPLIYWFSNFFFDLLSYAITVALVIILFFIFKRYEYVGRDTIGATLILFFLYGTSSIWMSYAASFIFRDSTTAANTVLLASFILGVFGVTSVTILLLFENTKQQAEITEYYFYVFPGFALGRGLVELANLPVFKDLGQNKSAFAFDVIGKPYLYMLGMTFVFAYLVFFGESSWHRSHRRYCSRCFKCVCIKKKKKKQGEDDEGDADSDVAAEREVVMSSSERKEDSVIVKDLYKKFYNGKVAVNHLTFGVKSKEIFALLGTNGAGKTTTISILCQKKESTSGSALICGYDVTRKGDKARKYIGYCPQFDACFDLLTVEEHLRIYTGIRTLDPGVHGEVVKRLLKMHQLTAYRKTRASKLSGGNRRKLSVALAFLGGPQVVFLDEPSAGMDPIARRGLWTTIATAANRCSIVLTTHHLEEVEALGHRVGIMVNGRLRCIGDKTHLKNKYGGDHEVSVSVEHDSAETEAALSKFFLTNFGSVELKEHQMRRYIYSLPTQNTLAKTFALLELEKDRLGITDYTVSNPSIEQVFIKVARDAEDADGS